MQKNNGVSYYTEATAKLFFPDGHVCCDLCAAMETYARKQCRLTGEYLADTRGIGYMCPLKFKERNEDLSEYR